MFLGQTPKVSNAAEKAYVLLRQNTVYWLLRHRPPRISLHCTMPPRYIGHLKSDYVDIF